MEKQTKILLGIGAAIAVYLILKPKKAAAAQTIVDKESSKKIETNEDEYICPSGYKLTPKPMGFSSMEVCEDANGNRVPFKNGKEFKSGASSLVLDHALLVMDHAPGAGGGPNSVNKIFKK